MSAPIRHRAAAQEDAEFSDIGRSPRFPRGWWLIPVTITGALGWGVFFWAILT